MGNAATGNRYRYRYYTCFSRQRYGAATCSAERLPAEELDAAVLDALLDTYGHYALFERAVRAAADCAERVRSLVTKLDDLRRQSEDAAEVLEAASTSPPTAERLADVRTEIQAAIETGTTPTKKALLQALVQEITVEGRHAIQPVFRVPRPNESGDGDAKVRAQTRFAQPPSFSANRSPLIEGSMISLTTRHAKVRREGYRR